MERERERERENLQCNRWRERERERIYNAIDEHTYAFSHATMSVFE